METEIICRTCKFRRYCWWGNTDKETISILKKYQEIKEWGKLLKRETVNTIIFSFTNFSRDLKIAKIKSIPVNKC